MIIQKERPTSGQWAVVWTFNDKTWSDIFKFEDGVAKIYVEDCDGFEPFGHMDLIESYGAIYIKMEG